MGAYAQGSLTTGADNVAVGRNSQNVMTTGSRNVAVGNRASFQLTTGDYNTHVGHWTGFAPGGNTAFATTTAVSQTVVGAEAGQSSATPAMRLTAVGRNARGATNALALGVNTTAGGTGSVAIGTDSTNAGASTSVQNEVALGTALHTVKITGRLNVAQRTPSGSADTQGQVGDITSDEDYLYVKTTAGWKRAALTAW